MSRSFINDPQHWRSRAEEMRALTDDVKDAGAKENIVEARRRL